MIYILHTVINETNHQQLLTKNLPKFSPRFQEKIKRYRRWQDAQASLIGRILLTEILAKISYKFNDRKIEYNDYNKPFLKDRKDIKFNISHSGEIVICAVTAIDEIGIDIEKITDVEIEIFKSQMTNNEWETIRQSYNKERAFFNYWTQKEAVIKAHGKGLSIPLPSFEVTKNKTHIETQCFYLKKLIINKGYSCHLALRQNIKNLDILINQIEII